MRGLATTRKGQGDETQKARGRCAGHGGRHGVLRGGSPGCRLDQFGDQGPSAGFGANAIVRIDGSITYETHCPEPGINDFFYPATDVYIVETGAGTGTLQDASGGRPNTIVSAATAFTDEVIAMTAPGGNLDDGDYDVVYDTCQDGQYDPGVDTIFPHAITVDMPYVAPLADDGIKEIKDESRQEYESWMQTRQMMSAIFKLADKAIKTQCKAGNPVGCVMKKVDYFGGVKERFLALLLSQANHYTLAYVGRDAAGNTRTCTTTVTVPKTCTGAHAAQAAKEVQLARREDAAR